MINESFEASPASSVCGEDSEGTSEAHKEGDIEFGINVHDSINTTVRIYSLNKIMIKCMRFIS